MSYFSRLTDIVTCNLTDILYTEADPVQALRQIIREMEDGLSGAQRSVATAAASEERLNRELEEHRGRCDRWTGQAKEELAAGREDQARLSLVRRQEVEDLIAGVLLQHQAAVATGEHLSTTLRALEARLAEARRKLQQLESGQTATGQAVSGDAREIAMPSDDERTRKIDVELERLKRELNAE